ncbi:DUF624 domain-containing protein [Caldibacillus lycopersici]|uniref:DUF624 domain-containing protein n=1 Tax=Perspicuibacillus lycopersici TaxID=1325689 RepID=A0AAE3IR30_9BACI|nr:DUF624 domain-containing protein [Perspicuibacillus lycopersici]MCU9612632.1 DUF624 domain-containing protein [Perspicuibacillus lycopersici]
MKNKDNKEFVDGKMYTFVNYVYWILASSVLFVVSNIVFVFALYVALYANRNQVLPTYLLLTMLVICAIPMGPSFTGLNSIMKKIVHHSDVAVVKDFFKGYTKNFKQATLAWVIILFFIALFSLNYYIIIKMEFATFLILPLFLFIAFLICSSFYIFPLISQYYMSLKDIFRLSLYFALKEFKATVSILIVFVVAAYLFFLLPTVFIVIAPGGLAFFIMYLTNKIFASVRASHKEDNSIAEGSGIM